MQERTIVLRSVIAKAVVALIAIVALGTAIIGAKWQLGDMLAATTDPADEQAVERSDAALRLAPADPRALALRAQIGDLPTSEQMPALELAENSVRAAPGDYRWRLILARALADATRVDDAEREFRRAIDLAPTYAVCRWYFGNFLLRQGRREEAFAQFRLATSDPFYRQQSLALVWDLTHDVAAVDATAGDQPDSTAFLSLFLAAHNDPEDALAVWNRLPDEEKRKRVAEAKTIATVLLQRHRYEAGLGFVHHAGEELEARPGATTNPSFESSVDSGVPTTFGWRIARNDPKLDLLLDDKVSHEGRRSLRMTFRGTARPDLFNTAQTVAVNPGQKYRLTFWVRTENLKAVSGPIISVATGDESKVLGATQPFPNGTSDWRQMTVDFSVPADVDGIEIRTLRGGCGGDDCVITGVVWYDDFALARL